MPDRSHGLGRMPKRSTPSKGRGFNRAGKLSQITGAFATQRMRTARLLEQVTALVPPNHEQKSRNRS
jgi:hypothetical protein